MGGGYFCYVHKNSKDPVLVKDPVLEAVRGLNKSITDLLEYHHRTGADISRYFGNYTPPARIK